MRLDRFLANNLSLSRREIQRVIKQGLVTVDGALLTKGDIKIGPENKVCLNGQSIAPLLDGYWMLHKPAGVVCANVDANHPTVIDIFPNDLVEQYRKKGLQIVGRLDADTTGLVLITSDGQWNHRVTSPKTHCAKRYRVNLKYPLSDEAHQQLKQGILLRGEKKTTRPAKIEHAKNLEYFITIYEGKYHQVKRMFAAVSNRVEALHRVRVGDIELDNSLAPGEYRNLSPTEINSIAS